MTDTLPPLRPSPQVRRRATRLSAAILDPSSRGGSMAASVGSATPSWAGGPAASMLPPPPGALARGRQQQLLLRGGMGGGDDYSVVVTPAIVPGVTVPAVMTWGDIAATPLLLDGPPPPPLPRDDEDLFAAAARSLATPLDMRCARVVVGALRGLASLTRTSLSLSSPPLPALAVGPKPDPSAWLHHRAGMRLPTLCCKRLRAAAAASAESWAPKRPRTPPPQPASSTPLPALRRTLSPCCEPQRARPGSA